MTIKSSAWRVSQSVLDSDLYDMINVMTLVCFGLKGGQFPPSNGVTNQPVGGGISIVSRTLPKLHAALTKYLDRARVLPDKRQSNNAAGAVEVRS